jgi:hypothetical protein
MKTLYKTGLAVIAAMALFTSCGGDDNESTGGNGPSTGSYINAKVDGADFKTMSIQGYTTAAAAKTMAGDQTFITISASSSETNSMVIALTGITAEGTYNVGPGTENVVSFVDFATDTAFNSSEDCSGATGTLKVTHYSEEKIEGTFTFTGKNDDCSGSKTVTNGKFRGEFTQG